MIQNARASATAAADNLLAIIKADRAWNDDGARKQLVQFFEARAASTKQLSMDEAAVDDFLCSRKVRFHQSGYGLVK